MKKYPKFFSLCVIIVLLLNVFTCVLAASNGTINISNAVVNQTYSIYRIFDLESYNTATGSYSYKVSPKWSDFFNAENHTAALIYFIIDSDGYATWNPLYTSEEHYASFARLSNDYAKNNGIENDGQKTASSTNVTFDNLPLGYYLVDTTMGSLCSLDTTNPTANIQEKNIAPTVEKLVREGTQYKSSNDVSIGDSVNFQTKIIAQKGAEKYILHDKMAPGFTWNQAVMAELNGESINYSNYKLRTCSSATACCEDCTFDVVFTDVFCNSLKANDEIVVSYSAYLNQDAVIGSVGNENTTWLSYGDSNNTVESTTTTYTWDINVFKYFNSTHEGTTVETPLANATFRLLKGSTPINFVRDTDDLNLYRICVKDDSDSHTHINEITTDDTGKFSLKGLDSGTYSLEEIDAPEGYNKLSSPIPVVIDSDGKVNVSSELPDGVTEIKVLNKSGAILPQTGGTGTTMFYVIGIMLILLSLIYAVIIKKKKKQNQELEHHKNHISTLGYLILWRCVFL